MRPPLNDVQDVYSCDKLVTWGIHAWARVDSPPAFMERRRETSYTQACIHSPSKSEWLRCHYIIKTTSKQTIVALDSNTAKHILLAQSSIYKWASVSIVKTCAICFCRFMSTELRPYCFCRSMARELIPYCFLAAKTEEHAYYRTFHKLESTITCHNSTRSQAI